MLEKGRKNKLIYIYDSKGCLIDRAASVEELKEKYSLQESIRFSVARGGIVEIEKNKTYCSRKVYNTEDFLQELNIGKNIKSVVRGPGKRYKGTDYLASDKMLIVSDLTGEKLAVYASIKAAIELSNIPYFSIYRALKIGKVKIKAGFILETK